VRAPSAAYARRRRDVPLFGGDECECELWFPTILDAEASGNVVVVEIRV
jgi:hypothetical protein